MSSSFVSQIVARYAMVDFSNIPHYPNVVPNMEDWVDCLLVFSIDDKKSIIQNIRDFNECMHQQNIYHEDLLMKIFLSSLFEG